MRPPVVFVDPVHVLAAEALDPFWRIAPPRAESKAPTQRGRDETTPDPVGDVDRASGSRFAERIWMTGARFVPELVVQRLHASLGAADEPGDQHADLRGCAEETRAWALEQAARAGFESARWRLSIEIVECWTVDEADLRTLPRAPNAKPDPNPVFEALAGAAEAQCYANRAEFRRVTAAVAAWRAALREEDDPGAANTHYQKGFFLDLGLTLGVADSTARNLVHAADRLARVLPLVWQRFADADVPWRAMQAAHAAIDGLHDEVLPRFDEQAAALMFDKPVVQLPDALRRLGERLQASTADDRFDRAFARRHVTVEAGRDGGAGCTPPCR